MRWKDWTVLGVDQSGVVVAASQTGAIVALVLSSLTVAVCHAVSVDFLYCTLTDVA